MIGSVLLCIPHVTGSVTLSVQGEVVLYRLMLRRPILTSSCWKKRQGWAAAAPRRAAAAAAVVSALCSALGRVKKTADGLSRLITLAPRLTAKTTQGKSNGRRPEPVKVSQDLVWNFNAWIQTKREVRGSCRRHQLELSPRISTEDRLARELARLQTIFNWLWLVSPCHSDSSGKYTKGQRPCELHDKPKAEFEA